MLFAIVVIAILGAGVPALFGFLVWRAFGLNKAQLSIWGAVAVFAAGAVTSFVFWGHAGPMPALMMLVINANGQYLPWALWMCGSGLCTLILFGWLSYRRSRIA